MPSWVLLFLTIDNTIVEFFTSTVRQEKEKLKETNKIVMINRWYCLLKDPIESKGNSNKKI